MGFWGGSKPAERRRRSQRAGPRNSQPRAQQRLEASNNSPLLLTNYDSDIAGLREAIFDNAILLLPKLVADYLDRERDHFDKDAFKIPILPIFTKRIGTDGQERISSLRYRASLVYQRPNERHHVQAAEGGDVPTIAQAYQSLLIILGAMLTCGHDEQLTLPRTPGYAMHPFEVEWGHVGSVEFESSEWFRSPTSATRAVQDRRRDIVGAEIRRAGFGAGFSAPVGDIREGLGDLPRRETDSGRSRRDHSDIRLSSGRRGRPVR